MTEREETRVQGQVPVREIWAMQVRVVGWGTRRQRVLPAQSQIWRVGQRDCWQVVDVVAERQKVGVVVRAAHGQWVWAVFAEWEVQWAVREREVVGGRSRRRSRRRIRGRRGGILWVVVELEMGMRMVPSSSRS